MSLLPGQPSGIDDLDSAAMGRMTAALRAIVSEMAIDMQKNQFEMEERLLSAIEEGRKWTSEESSKSKPRVWGSHSQAKRTEGKRRSSPKDMLKATEMANQLSQEKQKPAAQEGAGRDKLERSTSKGSKDGTGRAPTLETIGHQRTWRMDLWKHLSQPESSKAAKAYDTLAPILFLLTAGISLSQTLADPVLPHDIARLVNFVVDALFFAEIGLYWIVAPDRMAFLLRPINMIDIVVSALPLLIRLVSLLMHYEELLNNVVFLGVISVFRLSKIARRLQKMLLVKEALGQIAESLPVLLYILMVIVLSAAVAVYIVEDRETFPSLRGAIWFTAITMSTVGYGDMVPITPYGQTIVGLLAIMSLLYMAMPIGIIGHVFTDVWQRRDRILVCTKMQAILLLWGYTAQDIPTLFSIFDSKDEGALDFADFRRMMAQMQLGLSNERISALFQSIDSSGDGHIEEPDLVRALFPSNYHEIYGFEEEVDHFCACGTLLLPYATACRMCGTQVAKSPITRMATRSILPDA